MRRSAVASSGRDSRTIVIEVAEKKSRTSWLLRWALEAPQRWLGKRSTIGQDVAGGADGLSYLRHLARGNRIRRDAAFDELSPESPPVLIIHGDKDSLVPLSAARDAAGRVINGRISILKGCGHWPGRDAPEEFNRVLLEFLTSQTKE